MKTISSICLAACLLLPCAAFAQQEVADAPEVEAATSSPAPPAPELAPEQAPAAAQEPLELEQTTEPIESGEPTQSVEPTEPKLTRKWREEVTAWSDARRVEANSTSGPISEVNRSVLVLGNVDGDISVVKGNVAVLGEVSGNVSAVNGTVTVLGRVKGNASVVTGDLRVAGKVDGKTSAVGGSIQTAPGSELPGESDGVRGNFHVRGGHLNGNFHVRPSGKGPVWFYWFSPFMFLLRGGMLVLWVAVSCAMAAVFEPAISRARAELMAAPGRSAAFGFLWFLAFWVLLALCIILSMIFIGIPLALLLVTFEIVLRVFGMTVAFAAAGAWLARRLDHPHASIYAAVFLGACLIGLLRLVPVAGTCIWFAASLFGIGATLISRFGKAPANHPSLPPGMSGAVAA